MRAALLLVAIGSASLLSAQNWSAWRQDSVYPGIEVRERCTGFNEFANRYLWDVELRNTYQKPVDLAWAAEPEALRGSKAQTDRAMAVKPGEVVGAHHTAPSACSSVLPVRVDEVRSAGSTPNGSGVKVSAFHPTIAGHWRSKDTDPNPKELQVQLSGRTVTSTFSSPSFSFQVTTEIPERVTSSVSVETH